ncbi:MAG: response regulator [Candidatus Glassbacteria bacterium]|nr:response regulator [Candidatus Glassbacteria bacterium]
MSVPQIMVVEDEFVVAADIRSTLECRGYGVAAVVSKGQEAVRKAEELKPDLVLLDIVLEGEMDGIEAAGQLRSRFGIPVVYLTACADEEVMERAEKTGPLGYLVKPFNESTLISTVRVALKRAEVERSLGTKGVERRGKLSAGKGRQEMLTICFGCKKVLGEDRGWEHIEDYLHRKFGNSITHCICPECIKREYPDFYREKQDSHRAP